MGTSDLELKQREEALAKGEPNFCESCAMDLITCDCVNPRPVRTVQDPPQGRVDQ